MRCDVRDLFFFLVEVPGLVRKLRQCRFHMVQRKVCLLYISFILFVFGVSGSYIFIHAMNFPSVVK